MARIGELIGPNEEVIHPKTSASVVYLEDGRNVEQVLSDDMDYGHVVFQDNTYHFGSDAEEDFAKTMIIKGQTYQNILPEPSTHILSNNKGMFKVNEGLDPNVEIVDGISKSAILSGQTLVNLTTSSAYTLSKHINIVTGKTISIDVKSSREIKYTVLEKYTDWIYFHIPINLSMLKPNTKYLVIADAVENINYARICRGDGQYALEQSLGYFNGDKLVTLTTNDLSNNTLPDIKLYLRVKAGLSVGDVVYVKNVRLIEYQEGMERWSIPYFEGMTSCESPVLTTTGKNLLNPDWKKNTWYPFKLEKGTQLTLSTKDSVLSEGGNIRFKATDETDIWFAINAGVTKKSIILQKDAYLICNMLVGDIEYQMEYGSTATSYEPYKTNILHTPEEVVLKGIDDVKDTLNCNTGEYVECIGEITFDGSDDERWYYTENATDSNGIPYFEIQISNLKGGSIPLCGNMIVRRDVEGEKIANSTTLYGLMVNKSASPGIRIKNGTNNLTDFKASLQANPVTVQIVLATPTVKTVNLSSSGNWEKIVLDGSEGWEIRAGGTKYSYTVTNIFDSEGANGFCDTFKFVARGSSNHQQEECVTSANTNNSLSLFTNNASLSSVEKLKTHLQSNPITIWYQTMSHQDSTQVKQPIFFKEGHIIQSSGADHSLIPTLDYQAKTSNSYVMDLMKTNTRYTMKAKSASGTFTIDGTSYGAGTNGTFTTPSSMTNKLLVMNNKANEEVMILEGDVTSKTIPHFKGIKSAFEDEKEIEVLSQGKNLLSPELYVEDGSKYGITLTVKDDVFTLDGMTTEYHDLAFTPNNDKVNLKLEKGKQYRVSLNPIGGTTNYKRGVAVKLTLDDGTVKWLGRDINPSNLTMDGKISWIRIIPHAGDTFNNYAFTLQVEESSTPTTHEPYKSNSTKIPLLSPLKSLPNGVYDEVIVDRTKKKATIIQKSEKIVLNGSENWSLESSYLHDKLIEFRVGVWIRMKSILSDRFYTGGEDIERIACTNGGGVYIRILKSKVSSISGFKQWLSQNPTTVYYELETPIITEINLEGYPYIYKDGHIFLNSEIAPTVGMEYSLNQGHRIEGQAETLQRHEQQFTQLERYFADLVYSDYNYTLLRLNEELHQEEGDV